MILASIDIGTNTVLLLIARLEDDGSIIPLVTEQRIPRLGRGVDEKRNLSPASIERVIDVLRGYQPAIAAHRPASIIVCGTSAVRDAANREEFARLVKAKTGYALEILTGEEEALWGYRGAISGVPHVERATVVDIGGGSTEIAIGDSVSVSHRISIDIGSVRLTERYFRHDPPAPDELVSATQTTRAALAQTAGFPFTGSKLIGVAGTATSLALLVQKRKQFDIRAVTNYRLSRRAIEEIFRTLQSMSSTAIRDLSDAMEGRNDVITAGSLILREVMAYCNFEEIIVSERGVRYGLLLREAEKMR
jgi:exopolyphosphatase/guanosine-5'-triphosphate,3'-diphosphate pyrophosphatase